ncbi:MAG: hypothetical protein EA349_05725 [Halomonadaceae bacterium]|nr:MAG: hypothetical protein EA349_05725 [Halomonadaceae bacterium]
MFYRVIVFAIGLSLVALLFALMWAGAALFMRTMGDTERLLDRSRIIAVWTFAGFGVGLLFFGFGGPILGTYLFYRSARGTMPQVAEASILLWGLATVVLASALAGGILFSLILSMG